MLASNLIKSYEALLSTGTFHGLNAVFFTANNIAYAALVALVTKNSKERVEMGSWRFIFAFSTVLIIQSVTVKFVQILGGGAYAWKVVAIVFAIVGVIVNTISVFSVKELPEEELNGDGVVDDEIEKYGLVEAAKLLFSNKYYIMISVTYIVQQTYSAMLNMGIYYMTYVLLNEDLYAVVFLGDQYSTDHCTDHNTYPGSKMERTLQTEYCRLCNCNCRKSTCCCCSLYAQCTSYDSLYCCILIRTGTMAGRYGSSCWQTVLNILLMQKQKN